MEQNSEFWSYEELWIEEEFEEIEDTEDTEEIRENPGPAAFGYTHSCHCQFHQKGPFPDFLILYVQW